MHSCKPQVARTILSEAGMKEVLKSKLLISILAGVTIAQLRGLVDLSTRVVRAMPNTPCQVSNLWYITQKFILFFNRFVKE
jgi:pyrroline-5-carboxylate reductase